MGAHHRVVHSLSRPPVHTEFGYSLAERLGVAEVSERKPVDSRCDPGARPVIQTRQPIADNILPAAGNVPANLDHCSIVTYKSQDRKALAEMRPRLTHTLISTCICAWESAPDANLQGGISGRPRREKMGSLRTYRE